MYTSSTQPVSSAVKQLSILNDVDVVLFVVQTTVFTQGDEEALNYCRKTKVPVILVINKVEIGRASCRERV